MAGRLLYGTVASLWDASCQIKLIFFIASNKHWKSVR